MKFDHNLPKKSRTVSSQPQQESSGQSGSRPSFGKIVSTLLTGGLLASPVASALAFDGAQHRRLLGSGIADQGPHRGLLQCAAQAVGQTGSAATYVAQPAFVQAMMSNSHWAMANPAACDAAAAAANEPVSLTYSTDLTRAGTLIPNGEAYTTLSPTESLQVTDALDKVMAFTNLRFSAAATGDLPNLLFRGAPASLNPAGGPGYEAHAPGSFDFPYAQGGTFAQFFGDAWDTDPMLLQGAIATTLGVTDAQAVATGPLPTQGAFSRSDTLSTVMSGSANNCYGTTDMGALDYAALSALYGASRPAGASNVTFTAPMQGGGGLHLPGTQNAFNVGEGFNSIALTLVNDGTLVSQLNDAAGSHAYLLSPTSQVDAITVAGNTGATLVGNQNANDLRGGDGDDIIDGNGGDDNITTGAGKDIVVVNNDKGVTTVQDFDVHNDRLGVTFDTDVKALQVKASGTGTQLTFGNGKQVNLLGVDAAVFAGAAEGALAQRFTYSVPGPCIAGKSSSVLRGYTGPGPQVAPAPAPSATVPSSAPVAAPRLAPSPAVAPTAAAQPATKPHHSNIALIGAAIGIAVAALSATAAGAWALARRQRNKQQDSERPEAAAAAAVSQSV